MPETLLSGGQGHFTDFVIGWPFFDVTDFAPSQEMLSLWQLS
jgi:hypothetical protein